MSDETKFEIGNKAELLYYSVFDLTTNRQHYPVKFRRLADKLQEYALDIHSDVLDANSFPNNSIEHRQKRKYAELVKNGKMTRKSFDESYNS